MGSSLEGKVISEILTEYDGILDQVIDNVLVSETERFETEIEDVLTLFNKED